MKKFPALILVVLLLIAGCNASVDGTIEESPADFDETSEITSEVDFPAEKSDVPPQLIPITREQAGLNDALNIPRDKSEIHPTILEAYEYLVGMERNTREIFPDKFYRAGLEKSLYEIRINVDDRTLIISDWWTETIVSDIRIGSTQSDLMSQLGKPFVSDITQDQNLWVYLYKLDTYYIAFEGDVSSGAIQCAILVNKTEERLALPEQYRDIIAKLVPALEQPMDRTEWSEMLMGEDFADVFRDATPHTGWVQNFQAGSDYGIFVEEYPLSSDKTYTIYVSNYFSGELYQFEPAHETIRIVYYSTDARIAAELASALYYHREVHDLTGYNYKNISKNGRYYIKYLSWNSSIYNDPMVNSYAFLVYDSTLKTNPYFAYAPVPYGGVERYHWMDGGTIIYYASLPVMDAAYGYIEILDGSYICITYETDPDRFLALERQRLLLAGG